MNKLKKLYRKNKVMFILTSVAVVSMLTILLVVLSTFIGKGTTSKYGDRLDGINKVKLSQSFKKGLASFYEDETSVNESSVDLSGKIVYIIIDFKKGTSVEEAQKVASKGLDEFDEDELDFYDLQFILTSKEDSENKTYPTMGYKNNANNNIVWIKKTK